MGHWDGKYVIGLTGNIGTGKTLVSKMLQHLGASIINADSLTHRLMAPGAPAYRPIIETFGRFILNEDNSINRKRLAEVAFSQPNALKTLEDITHKHIRQAIDILVKRSKSKVVVVEAIKLLEGDLSGKMDAVWVVDATPTEQLQRVIARDKLPQEQAQQRIDAQNPQNEKLSKATVIIKNHNNAQQDTWKQVQAAWAKIGKSAEAETAAAEAVKTVQVKPQPAPPAQPASAPEAAAPVTPPPTGGELSEFNIKRPRPADFDKIADVINSATGGSTTSDDIMDNFLEKTYLLAESGEQGIGVISFVVENLVTRVDEFYIKTQTASDAVGKGLIEQMEIASDQLNSEIAFIFLPTNAEDSKAIFSASGYESTVVNDVKYPAWREAITEHKPENTDLFSKRLRENLVLKPI